MDYSNLMDHSGFVIEKMYDIEKSLSAIDKTERGYMLTEDSSYLRGMKRQIDSAMPANIAILKKLTKDNVELQKNIDSFCILYKNRVNALKENIAFVDSSTGSNVSKYYDDSRNLMQQCSRLFKIIHDSERKVKVERLKEEQFYENLTRTSIRWLLFVFCIITLFLFALLIKELSGRMRYQEELQAKVLDLKRSHSELQEIAYIASHDLQEPLRKIQVFSNMLYLQKSQQIDGDFRNNLQRINNAAGKMQSLISDLTSLTSLTKIDEAKKQLDLGRMLQFMILDLEDKIKDKGATIDIKTLPALKGYENQIKILFNALLDNALKFSRQNIRPEIIISSMVTNGSELHEINSKLLSKNFNCISIVDNGIGFEKQFISKMFRIFQRLHHDDSGYDGKGIGLAICQRIMANHEGYIVAAGATNKGATFKLFFPVDE